jgi:hypothetical protein
VTKHLLAATGCALLFLSLGCSDDEPGATGGTSASSSTSVGEGGTGGSTGSTGGAGAASSGGAGGTGGVAGAGGQGGSGGAGGSADAYPPGPYGLDVGEVAPNLELQGFVDSTVSQTLVTIRLEDFYNPTGDGTYPADSQYGAGAAKPKALLLNFAARWAGSSDNESGQLLPPRYRQYAPMSGQFLGVLIESTTAGQAADAVDLATWTTKHSTQYPAAIDPSATIQPTLEAYPTNLVIDPRTMVVVDRWLGAAGDEVWATFEDVLAL